MYVCTVCMYVPERNRGQDDISRGWYSQRSYERHGIDVLQ